MSGDIILSEIGDQAPLGGSSEAPDQGDHAPVLQQVCAWEPCSCHRGTGTEMSMAVLFVTMKNSSRTE